MLLLMSKLATFGFIGDLISGTVASRGIFHDRLNAIAFRSSIHVLSNFASHLQQIVGQRITNRRK
jgi:hypothetical protein